MILQNLDGEMPGFNSIYIFGLIVAGFMLQAAPKLFEQQFEAPKIAFAVMPLNIGGVILMHVYLAAILGALLVSASLVLMFPDC